MISRVIDIQTDIQSSSLPVIIHITPPNDVFLVVVRFDGGRSATGACIGFGSRMMLHDGEMDQRVRRKALRYKGGV